MFDPIQGRWTTEDPIGFSAADENLYRYVGNDPTNSTDPRGLQNLGGGQGAGGGAIPPGTPPQLDPFRPHDNAIGGQGGPAILAAPPAPWSALSRRHRPWILRGIIGLISNSVFQVEYCALRSSGSPHSRSPRPCRT